MESPKQHQDQMEKVAKTMDKTGNEDSRTNKMAKGIEFLNRKSNHQGGPVDLSRRLKFLQEAPSFWPMPHKFSWHLANHHLSNEESGEGGKYILSIPNSL